MVIFPLQMGCVPCPKPKYLQRLFPCIHSQDELCKKATRITGDTRARTHPSLIIFKGNNIWKQVIPEVSTASEKLKNQVNRFQPSEKKMRHHIFHGRWRLTSGTPASWQGKKHCLFYWWIWIYILELKIIQFVWNWGARGAPKSI